MANTTIPVACSLTDSQLRERRNTVLRQVGGHILEVKELENGYAFRFPAVEQRLAEVTQMISLERECCPFLDFTIRIAAGDDNMWVELSGPEEAKAFVATMFEVISTLGGN